MAGCIAGLPRGNLPADAAALHHTGMPPRPPAGLANPDLRMILAPRPERAMAALPAVVEAIGGHATVWRDSGVRRGSDVAKALGAEGVMFGRPVLRGLATAGERGATHALSLPRRELDITRAYLGCRSPAEITRALRATASRRD